MSTTRSTPTWKTLQDGNIASAQWELLDSLPHPKSGATVEVSYSAVQIEGKVPHGLIKFQVVRGSAIVASPAYILLHPLHDGKLSADDDAQLKQEASLAIRELSRPVSAASAPTTPSNG